MGRHAILGTVLVALALLHAVTHDEWREERERLERENAELRKLLDEWGHE